MGVPPSCASDCLCILLGFIGEVFFLVFIDHSSFHRCNYLPTLPVYSKDLTSPFISKELSSNFVAFPFPPGNHIASFCHRENSDPSCSVWFIT